MAGRGNRGRGGGESKQANEQGPRSPAGRKAPALPESMDESIKKVYEKENTLREQLRELQAKHAEQIKTARATRVASPKQDPERGKKLDAFEAEMNERHDRVHEINTQINALHKSVSKHRNMAEGMSILELKCGPLRDDIKDINQRLRKIEDDAGNLKSAAKRMEARLTTTKVQQLEKELGSINKQIDQYKSGKAANTAISHLEQQRTKAERTLEQAKEYWEILEKVYPLTEEISELNAKKEAKSKELKAIDQKKDEWRKAQTEEKEAPEKRKENEAKLDALNKERKALRDEIDELKKKKNNVRTDSNNAAQGERKVISDQIDVTRKRMDEVRDELKKLQSSIPSQSVKFETDLLSTIIGPKGARIKQLQEDYGVYIQVEDDGTVNIRGTKEAVADAADAVNQILTAARDNRTKDTVKLPQSVKVADVIGRKGANIKSIQNRSGVQRIDINSDKGEIEITGPSNAVAEAKAMFEELLGNQHREVVPFKQQWANFLTPEKKQAILDETGVKFINIEREKGAITLMGKKADCEAAKNKLESYFNSFSESSVQMHLGEDLYRIVQNARSNLLQKIQDATSTVIEDRKLPPTSKPQGKGNQASPCLLKIHGPKEGVAAAQAMISDLMSGLKLEYPLNRFNILMRDRGSLLRHIENTSGAIVLVQKGTSNVSISLHGQEKARTKAKELVEQNVSGLEIACPSDKAHAVLSKASSIEHEHPNVSVCVDTVGGKTTVVICSTDNAEREAVKKEVEELLTKAVVAIPYNTVLFDSLRGTRGSKEKPALKTIESETGANIHISKDGTITIMGDEKVLGDAESRVRALLEQENNKLANVALKAREVIPRVIGRGGATIQKLQKDHNVHINIDNDKLTASIYGEGAQACKDEIDSIVSKFLAEKDSRKGGDKAEEKQ